MRRPSCYLAGPISGLTYDGAQEWRDYVRQSLAPEIECYSPLRYEHHLKQHVVLEQAHDYHPLTSDRGIMTRDHYDCMTRDLVFVNLLGAGSRVSIGTVMEIAWAFAYRKPLVLAVESGSAHEHPMIREATGFRVGSLDEAINVTRAVLLP